MHITLVMQLEIIFLTEIPLGKSVQNCVMDVLVDLYLLVDLYFKSCTEVENSTTMKYLQVH